MHIVMVSDTFRPRMGGIETQVADLADHLARAGHHVTVLTTTGAEGPPDTPGPPYRVIRSVWPALPRLPVDPRAPRRFVDLIDGLRPDIVHLHMGEVTPVVQAMLGDLARRQVPSLVTVHSIWSSLATIPLYRMARVVDLGFPGAIAWSAVSELVASRVRKVLGAGATIHLVPNGVDAPDWRRPAVAHEGLLAVTATRFAPRKRAGALLRLLRDLDTRMPGGARGAGLRVVLAGEGPGLRPARSFVRRHDLGDWVALPGRLTRPQLIDLYAGADVYLAPSTKEAASIAGREALAAGLAVLTRAQSGLAEVIEDGVNGVLAPEDEDMGAILEGWLRDPTSLRAIQEHNRASLPDCDWSSVLPRTLCVYREVIAATADRLAAPSGT